ncbi:MAG: hypothetical protein IT561_16535 [Alphaproteobacteria bacterium]|nr:hypothetical protein [Alphaproteobacteria bacterium]
MAAPAAGLSTVGGAASPQRTVASGSYECLHFASARLGIDFEIAGDGPYSDSEDKKGTWRFDGTWLSFRGGCEIAACEKV